MTIKNRKQTAHGKIQRKSCSTVGLLHSEKFVCYDNFCPRGLWKWSKNKENWNFRNIKKIMLPCGSISKIDFLTCFCVEKCDYEKNHEIFDVHCFCEKNVFFWKNHIFLHETFFVVVLSRMLYELPRRKPGWRFTAGFKSILLEIFDN